MKDWLDHTTESKDRWEKNAFFWDDKMGPESNSFHRNIIRPGTEELLEIQPGQHILDISCGNGNFSRRLVELGASVVAFDFSEKLVEHARTRSQDITEDLEYHVLDATNKTDLLSLGMKKFDSAVANMALMDISDISTLAECLPQLLKGSGKFVFSISHPCFQTPDSVLLYEEWEEGNEIKSRSALRTSKYIEPLMHEGIAIDRQPVPHLYFHRSLTDLLSVFFANGWVLDGIREPIFANKKEKQGFQWTELPPALIVRLRNNHS